MYTPSLQIEEIVELVRQQVEAVPNGVALLLVAEHSDIDLTALCEALNAAGVQYLGGLFPALIDGVQKRDRGVICRVLPMREPVRVVQGLESTGAYLESHQWPNYFSQQAQGSALVLVDGLTANIATFLSQIYESFGNSVRCFGGGAGSLSLEQKPCLFCNEGLFQDAALVAFVEYNFSLGVQHGWQRLMGPIIASRTHKNRVQELNWQSAFSLYQQAVEEDANVEMNAENFFGIAKGYPFGITQEEAEDLVRDPILVRDETELVCVGEVPENSALYILRGEAESLIGAAQRAAEQSVPPTAFQETLVIDCISRVLFLEDQFEQELVGVRQGIGPEVPLYGALTLGEIASYGRGYLEFFNKTIVVNSLYEKS